MEPEIKRPGLHKTASLGAVFTLSSLSSSFLTSLLVCWLGLLGYAPTLSSTAIHARTRRTVRLDECFTYTLSPTGVIPFHFSRKPMKIGILSSGSSRPKVIFLFPCMLNNSTLGFGQSVRRLKCLADSNHCCLHVGVFIRAEGEVLSLGDLVEFGTVWLSRDTWVFLPTRVLPSFRAIILYPTIHGLMSTCPSIPSPSSKAGLL